MSRYAVIDIETTGYSPAHNHRILEIGLVLVDDSGFVVYEWETLLNPQRDVGATEIHGITAADVYSAPTFDQVAGELEYLLSGRVPVAHNLAFDASFVVAEFNRLGYNVPLSRTSGLCTMRLASRYLPKGPRTLEACCGCVGVELLSAHAALEDARAAAGLLSHYLSSDPDFLNTWAEPISVAQSGHWPGLTPQPAHRVNRRAAAIAAETHFLGRLASRTPRFELHPEANSYIAVLDRALLDRQLSFHEQDELVAVAQMMGLSQEDVLAIHHYYLRALGRLALEDGKITADEYADLQSVAFMLGLGADELEQAFVDNDGQAAVVCEVAAFCLSPGDAVVFTGEAPGTERADLEYQARSLGLRVTGAVSGKTSLVIAADPDSFSGKARKARELQIPIIDYQTYGQLLKALAGR